MLLIPDLLGFWLTGVRAAEPTNASTTGLLDPATGDWATDLVDELGLPRGSCPICEPGERLGPLLPTVVGRDRPARRSPVTLVGSHDTASAVVGGAGRGRRRSRSSRAGPGRSWASSSSRRS